VKGAFKPEVKSEWMMDGVCGENKYTAVVVLRGTGGGGLIHP